MNEKRLLPDIAHLIKGETDPGKYAPAARSHRIDGQHGVVAHADSPPTLAVEVEHEGVLYSGTLYPQEVVQNRNTPARDLNCLKSGKRLARVSSRGIFLWCKACQKSHCIPWHVIEGLRYGVAVEREPDESA